MIRVVAAVIVHRDRTGTRVLACRRTHPAELAGLWEFPGGKVEPGETDEQALHREIAEELRIGIHIHGALGPDLAMVGGQGRWQPYVATVAAGEPELVDHDQMRWLGADDLSDVPWLSSDVPIMTDVAQLLRRARDDGWPGSPVQ